MRTKYTVTNVYGVRGGTTHRTPDAAIKAARKREGDGWVVVDSDGNQWWTDDRNKAKIVREARHA